jgi:hypothetical protein
MPSGIKPTSIALFPTAADRSTLTSAHQQYYLSPPLTPYSRYTPYNEQSDRTSPVTSSYQPSLPALQEMLPNETKQEQPSTDAQAQHQHSAPARHSERDAKETVGHSSPSTYHGGQPPTDPVRLVPLYSAQQHNTVSQTTNIIPPLRRNKAHVASACVNCKKAHLACDGNDPHAFSPSIYLWIPIFFFLFFFFSGIRVICRFATESGCMSTSCATLVFGSFFFPLFACYSFSFSFSFFFYLFYYVGPNLEQRVGGGSGIGEDTHFRLQCGLIKVLGQVMLSENVLSRGDPPIRRAILFCTASVA